MHTFTLAEARAQFGRLIALVESGEEVTITKRGRAVARVVTSVPAKQQLPSLAEFRAQQPEQPEPAGEFMRRLRESERY
ncbi:MAG: type II toxin-antitoxin system prevent-host-death family antitoxin [Burkholderiales bacterium]|nr:type II toxin-antitoxin system prevent-host-death family antitoxin [Burkholderiales bacterium]